MDAACVSSYTEWGPLQEVIVGDVANGYVPSSLEAADLSFRLFYGSNVGPPLDADGASRLPPGLALDTIRPYAARVVEERREDVETLVATLESLGVTVRRPQRLDAVGAVATPDWTSLTHFAHNVRDQTLIVGDEIIETPPLCRHRYFENDLLKPLFEGYFRAGARWTVAPRPRMLDASFDRAATPERPGEGEGQGAAGVEMMFDAAQCLRFGSDIVMNVATEHHRLGARWLQRHLGERFTVHVMHGLGADHIDATMMPLRPGVMLVNPRKLDGHAHLLPEALRNWDTISCCEPDASAYDDGELLLASDNISANVLAIDEDRVIVNASATSVIQALERHGFTPIPLRLRHSRLYGGGFHCITLDVRRADQLEAYL